MALLAGLLAGGSMTSGVTPASARPHRPPSLVSATLATTTATAGDPTVLRVRLRPARATRVVVQQAVRGRWTTYAATRTSRAGRAVVRIRTSAAGARTFRVVRPASPSGRRAVSRPVRLTVVGPTGGCTPAVALVDPSATPAARCVAARLDRWQRAGVTGVGQQLNVSNAQYLAPLTALRGRRVKVVGFDLEELAAGQTYGFATPPLDALVAQARSGAVLSMSWHAPNPGTGGGYGDRSWRDLAALVSRPDSAAYQRFWSTWTDRLALLRQLQSAGVAVVFRPFHEANGAWFWWGQPDATAYRQLWSLLQRRTWDAGVHNVVWGYSFNARTSGVHDPVPLLPGRVDLAGLDSYSRSSDALSTAGYAQVAARVRRMAFTEAGPYQVPDGRWSPTKVTAAAGAVARTPLWSMFWFDDGGGRKQLASLAGGLQWLDSCRDGFCLPTR